MRNRDQPVGRNLRKDGIAAGIEADDTQAFARIADRLTATRGQRKHGNGEQPLQKRPLTPANTPRGAELYPAAVR